MGAVARVRGNDIDAAVSCQSCDARSQLYLCRGCADELRELLVGLVTGGIVTDQMGHERRVPGLLEDLEDAATGQVRFDRPRRRERGALAEAPLRFNTRARALIDEIRTELTTWATYIAAAYDNSAPAPAAGAAVYAHWLADRTHTLAGVEGVGQLLRRLTHLTKQAKNRVDAPTSWRFCGQCDTMIGRKMCGLAIYAPRDAIEVICFNPECRTRHNVEKLYNRTLNSVDYRTFPREVLIGNQRTDSPERYTTGIMGELGEFVHHRTFRRWVSEGHVKPVFYLRPDGRRGVSRDSPDDVPEYRLSDVRNVKRQMTQNQKTGRAKAG